MCEKLESERRVLKSIQSMVAGLELHPDEVQRITDLVMEFERGWATSVPSLSPSLSVCEPQARTFSLISRLQAMIPALSRSSPP